MRETFAEAEVQGSAAIMFIFLDGLTDGHTERWLSLREELVRFGRPVVDIYRNSTLSEGDNVPWMKITVDTRSAEVFSFVSQTPERASPSAIGAATRIGTSENLITP
jgi:hypothetical protein